MTQRLFRSAVGRQCVRPLVRWVLLIVAFHAGGCAGAYHVAVLNMTEHDMDDVSTQVGNQTVTHGYLAPDTWKSWGLIRHPVPAKAVIRWQDNAGQSRKRVIDIPRSLRHFDGYIYFRFRRDDQIDVVPVGRGIEFADPRSARAIATDKMHMKERS